ncbi:MAG: hypothetical protein R2697_08445 [Ilumatobacteraceae bacterium]
MPDLVTANNIKVFINLVVTAIALPVFIINGDVVWGPALVLASVSRRWMVRRQARRHGGEQLVRIFMIVAALPRRSLIGIW